MNFESRWYGFCSPALPTLAFGSSHIWHKATAASRGNFEFHKIRIRVAASMLRRLTRRVGNVEDSGRFSALIKVCRRFISRPKPLNIGDLQVPGCRSNACTETLEAALAWEM